MENTSRIYDAQVTLLGQSKQWADAAILKLVGHGLKLHASQGWELFETLFLNSHPYTSVKRRCPTENGRSLPVQPTPDRSDREKPGPMTILDLNF